MLAGIYFRLETVLISFFSTVTGPARVITLPCLSQNTQTVYHKLINIPCPGHWPGKDFRVRVVGVQVTQKVLAGDVIMMAGVGGAAGPAPDFLQVQQ